MKSDIIILIVIASCLADNQHDAWIYQFKTNIEYLMTRPNSKSILDYLPPPQVQDTKESYICNICDVLIEVAINGRKMGVQKDVIAGILVQFCIWIGAESELSCTANVNNIIDIWLYAVDHTPTITSKSYCAYSLQSYGCQDPDRENWILNIPPKPILKYKTVNDQSDKLKSPLKILHLTDIHYDPAYEPGSDITCDLSSCCQNGSKAKTDERKAGYWGAYRCDSPWHVLENLLTHVMEKHKTFDIVYFTGDIIKHNEWLTGISKNSRVIVKVYNKFKEVFQSIPLFPVLGNHEPHPAHQFSSGRISENTDLSTQWLYDLVAESWKTWLPLEAIETVLKGGYYTVLIKPGLRLIALNSNVCYSLNTWLFLTDEDLRAQLQWMVETLQISEQNLERVHIISHIPSNDRYCFSNWASEYVRVLERYSHIIAAQFNGHTHFDDTIVYFNSMNRTQAISAAFVGGSATTFTDVNPNYKVFYVDPNTYDVLNIESWMFSITEANLTPGRSPYWYKLYDFKDAFGVPSLYPQDIAHLALRMTEDSALLQKYYRFQSRLADGPLAVGCDMQCEISNLCYIVTPWYGDDSYCKYYTALYTTNNLQYYSNE